MRNDNYPPDIGTLADEKQIEKQDEIQEETTSMEEKLEALARL